MKKTKCILTGIFISLSINAFASSVSEKQTNFCQLFTTETISECKQYGGGSICDIPNTYAGMHKIYNSLLSFAGSQDPKKACEKITKLRKKPEEAQNCLNKWNCFNSKCAVNFNPQNHC